MIPPSVDRVTRRLTTYVPVWAWTGVTVLVLMTVGLWLVGPRERLNLAAFVGRFHPSLVHLPIGGLIVALVLAAASRMPRFEGARQAVTPVLLLSAAGALAAVVAGQLHSAEGGFAGTTYLWHRRLGYSVAVVSALATAASWTADTTRDARHRLGADVALLLSFALLVVAGHLGGTLTHGDGYLTEYMPAPFNRWFQDDSRTAQAAQPVRPSDVVVYPTMVAPILEDHCVACHGPDTANGGLRLDTPEHVRTGGRTGAVVVGGQAGASDLVRRLWLPASHKDVMPPRTRPPLPVADASVLRWWVDQGASFEATLADVEVAPEIVPALQARVGELALDAPALPAIAVPPLNATALAALTREGLPVSRLAEGVDFLQVHARGMGTKFGDAQLSALLPVAANIIWMDLGGTAVTDDALDTLATFPNLTRLHLDRTAVSDAGLAAVAGLSHLEWVNLYDTKITDAGLQRVSAIASLRTAYVAETGVTPDGLQAASRARPDLALHAGITEDAASPPAAARATRPVPSR